MSLFFKLPVTSSFPSPPVFLASTAYTYMISAMQAYSGELSELGPGFSTRYYIGIFLSFFVLLLLTIFRYLMGCEGMGVLVLSLLFGFMLGLLLVYQNNTLLGKDALNVLGVPYFANRTADGKPIYEMPLPGIGEGFFTVIRNTIVSGFLALPIVLITLSGFLATSTANVGFILVFLAQIFVIPLLQFLLGKLRGLGFIQNLLKLDPTLSYAKMNKLCSISPADVMPDMVPPPTSYWMANVIFFFTYSIVNASTLLTASSESSEPDPTKVENRKAQAITALILLSAVFLVLLYNYVAYVGCETPGSVALAVLVYAPLGYGWYRLAELCGLRTADLFGIAGQLYIPTGDTTYPYACVNMTATTGVLYRFGTYGNLKPDEFVSKFISKDVPNAFAELTYTQDNQGIPTFKLVLNKQDAALDSIQSALLGSLADNFRKAFDTPDTTRVTQESSGSNNRIVTLTATPRAAATI